MSMFSKWGVLVALCLLSPSALADSDFARYYNTKKIRFASEQFLRLKGLLRTPTEARSKNFFADVQNTYRRMIVSLIYKKALATQLRACKTDGCIENHILAGEDLTAFALGLDAALSHDKRVPIPWQFQSDLVRSILRSNKSSPFYRMMDTKDLQSELDRQLSGRASLRNWVEPVLNEDTVEEDDRFVASTLRTELENRPGPKDPRRFVQVLTCKGSEALGVELDLHLFVFGGAGYHCRNAFDGRTYVMEMRTIGPGLMWGMRNRLLVVISNLVPVHTQGYWFGAAATVMPFWGFKSGVFIGNWLSQATLLGFSEGIGFSAGASMLHILD